MIQEIQNTNVVPFHQVQRDSIEVELRQERGREVIHPVCKTALLFAHLAKQKTLSMGDIKIIKNLGYSVSVKQTQPHVL